jgi:hypothetical protein
MKISNKTAAFGTILIIYESNRTLLSKRAELLSNQDKNFTEGGGIFTFQS